MADRGEVGTLLGILAGTSMTTPAMIFMKVPYLGVQ